MRFFSNETFPKVHAQARTRDPCVDAPPQHQVVLFAPAPVAQHQDGRSNELGPKELHGDGLSSNSASEGSGGALNSDTGEEIPGFSGEESNPKDDEELLLVDSD